MPDGGASCRRIINVQDFICFIINDDDLLANFGRFETTFERFPNFFRVSGLSGAARQTGEFQDGESSHCRHQEQDRIRPSFPWTEVNSS